LRQFRTDLTKRRRSSRFNKPEPPWHENNVRPRASSAPSLKSEPKKKYHAGKSSQESVQPGVIGLSPTAATML
jgi:hypothetical protein